MGTREGQRLIRPVDAVAVPVRNNMVRPVSLGDSTAEKILGMQKTVGNQAVQHMASTCPSFPSACPTGGACHACPVRVQPKLTIGKPGDKYEQEADRVAEQVMSIPEPRIRRQVEPEEEEKEEEIQSKPIAEQITPLIQRQVEPEEKEEEEEEEPIQTKLTNDTQVQRQAEEPEEEEEEPVQTKPSGGVVLQRQEEEPEEEEEEEVQAKSNGSTVAKIKPSIETGINSLSGGGQPLRESTRKYFEPRFGSSFNNVRIHNNSQAADIAKSINAKAFTTGKDIVFGAGQYSPETSGGKRLLAHELTHVVQQGRMGDGLAVHRLSTAGASSLVVQLWKITGNKAVSDDSRSDTLWGLSRRITGTGMNWPCIQPTKMQSPSAKGRDYPLFIRKDDEFDVSNLRLTTGPSLNLRLLRDNDPPSPYGLALGKVYGGAVTIDPEADIERFANYGRTPVASLVLAGHIGGTWIWGGKTFWNLATMNPEMPTPTRGQAQNGMFPHRCWFTRNAQVRIVGCNSQTVARPFARAFMRRGAIAIGTNHDVCGWQDPTWHWRREVFMTFDRLPCIPPHRRPRRRTAAEMNGVRGRWVTIRGRL